jgi:ABC-type Fe3+-hydroxamate transport system substrate-binding protein
VATRTCSLRFALRASFSVDRVPVFRFPPLVLSSVTCLLAAAACSAPRSETPRAPALRDDFGVVIDMQRAPQRIISLNPTTTEILFALGASHRLVGRSQWDVFPDSALAVPSLGQALRPNVEALLAAHPDLVVLYASADNRAAFDRLRQSGINAVAFKIDSIEQFARDTRLLARILGDSTRGATLVDSIQATLARVRAATTALSKPTVFIHAWDTPIIAIGGGSFMSELLDIAGARNVYGDIPGPSGPVTLEDAIRRNPDFVLATPVSAPKMRASDTWQTIPAVRNGHVLVYDTVLFSRPSVQLGAAAVSIANLLHPGVVR